MAVLCVKFHSNNTNQITNISTHSLYASYATSCTSSACRAMQQPSCYLVPANTPADVWPYPVPVRVLKCESGTT